MHKARHSELEKAGSRGFAEPDFIVFSAKSVFFSANFYQILQNFTKFYKILPNFTTCFKFWQFSIKFYQILPNCYEIYDLRSFDAMSSHCNLHNFSAEFRFQDFHDWQKNCLFQLCRHFGPYSPLDHFLSEIFSHKLGNLYLLTYF